MKQKRITESVYNGFPIRADEDHPVIGQMMDKAQEFLEYMLEERRLSQVIVVNCVAKFPEEIEIENPSEKISKAMRKFHQKAKREKIEILMIWSREQDTSSKPHFNVNIIADGTRVQNGFAVGKSLNAIWARELGADPLSNPVHICKTDPDKFPPLASLGLKPSYEIRIRKNSQEAGVMKANAINAISYFAKCKSKENNPSGCRSFGFSQIPRSNQRREKSE